MIIKTFSRTSPSMQDIVHYIADKDKAEERPLLFYRNVPAPDLQSIIHAFEDNLTFQTAQNTITAYHNILSFHPSDVPHLSPDALYALVQQYIALRAPKSLWFGQLHSDQTHPHVHLLLSGNEYQSRKASRLSRPDFYQLRVDIEQYQKERFPELVHSLHYEKMRMYPLHLLYSRLASAYEQAQSKQEFWDMAHSILKDKARVEPNKHQISYLGKTYSLADIGIDLDLFERLQELQHIRQLSKERERDSPFDFTH